MVLNDQDEPQPGDAQTPTRRSRRADRPPAHEGEDGSMLDADRLLTADDVRSARFHATKDRPGYDQREVDAFLEHVELTLRRLEQHDDADDAEETTGADEVAEADEVADVDAAAEADEAADAPSDETSAGAAPTGAEGEWAEPETPSATEVPPETEWTETPSETEATPQTEWTETPSETEAPPQTGWTETETDTETPPDADTPSEPTWAEAGATPDVESAVHTADVDEASETETDAPHDATTGDEAAEPVRFEAEEPGDELPEAHLPDAGTVQDPPSEGATGLVPSAVAVDGDTIRATRFRLVPRELGYLVEDVDTLLDQLAAAVDQVHAGADPAEALAMIDDARFGTTWRGGYDQRQVDALLERVGTELRGEGAPYPG